MKTPREILLERHQVADGKLDAIRRQVLQSELKTEPPGAATPTPWLAVLWQQLIWPCRRAWMGLAAAWVVIGALQALSGSSLPPGTARHVAATPPEIMALLQAQQRLRAELLGAAPLEHAAAPSRPWGPRSDVLPPRDSAWRRIEVGLA